MFVSPSFGSLRAGYVRYYGSKRSNRNESATCEGKEKLARNQNRGSYTICPGSGTDLRIPSACRMFRFSAIEERTPCSSGGRRQTGIDPVGGGRVKCQISKVGSAARLGKARLELGAKDKFRVTQCDHSRLDHVQRAFLQSESPSGMLRLRHGLERCAPVDLTFKRSCGNALAPHGFSGTAI
jgi:hypothetical protein